jgi:hypothetical protein
MTNPVMPVTTDRPQRGRSVRAVVVAFIVVFVLSLGTDQVLHMLTVYPPWGEPMYDPGLNLLALTYRTIYGIVGGYIAARLAPYAPMGHALTVGIIGFVLSAVGAIVAITQADLGPAWYPIALALTSVPTAWLGGYLYVRKASST